MLNVYISSRTYKNILTALSNPDINCKRNFKSPLRKCRSYMVKKVSEKQNIKNWVFYRNILLAIDIDFLNSLDRGLIRYTR